jgi:hemoglobin
LAEDRRYAGVRALHGPDLSDASQGLLAFLAGWLGGPPLYFQKPGNRCVMSAHAGFPIGLREVQQWLDCMAQALQDCGIEKEPRLRIQEALERMAQRMRNRA